MSMDFTLNICFAFRLVFCRLLKTFLRNFCRLSLRNEAIFLSKERKQLPILRARQLGMFASSCIYLFLVGNLSLWSPLDNEILITL